MTVLLPTWTPRYALVTHEAEAVRAVLVLLAGAEGLIGANLGERLDGLLTLVDGGFVILLIGDEDGVLLIAESLVMCSARSLFASSRPSTA